MTLSATPQSIGEPYNVLPSDYGSHLAVARERDLVLWENHGWGVRSTAGDGDALLWVAAYQLRSRRGRPFVKPEFCALQSMVAHVEYTAAEKARMNDNDFVAVGWNGMDDLRDPADLTIDVGADRAVWAIDGMRFTAAPPDWSVQGADRDLRYDLHLHADSPAFWLTDRRLSALEHGDRWHLVNARSSGEMSVAGRRIGLDGMGWHERHIHLNDHYDPVNLLAGPGIVFHNGYGNDVHFHLMGRPRLGVFRAKILCQGEEINFTGPGSVAVEETDFWIDPRSKLQVATAWRVRCRDASSSFDLEVRAFARTYYLWNFLSGGVNILHWWLAESRGRLERAGSPPLQIEAMKHVVHQNLVFHRYT